MIKLLLLQVAERQMRDRIAQAVRDEIAASLAPPVMPAARLQAFCERVAERAVPSTFPNHVPRKD